MEFIGVISSESGDGGSSDGEAFQFATIFFWRLPRE